MNKLGLYFFIFLSTTIFAQVQKLPADTEFFYTYGGVNNDETRDIVEAYDKGYLLVGTTSSFGQGNTSFYIIKTDSLGNHQWSSVQGGSQNDWAYTVQRTKDSCYLVAGYSNSFATSSMNNYSAYYLKIDRNGNLIWQKSIDKGSWSFVYGSCALPDSGFVLCGQTYATTQGDADGYLIRIDKNGDTLWTKHYGGNQDEVFNSVCIMNNSLYVVGSNNSRPTDGNSDGWLVKLDLNGNQLLENFISYGDSIQETINGITPYNDSLFTVCGSALHLDSNTAVGIINKHDTSLLLNFVVDNGGYTQPKGYFTQYNKVLNISYNQLCVIGTKFGGSGNLGMFFVGFDKNGYYISDYSPVDGGTQNDYGYSGIYTSAGKVIGVGSTYSTGEYCTNNNMGAGDAFLIRYNADSIHSLGVKIQYNCFADTLAYWEVGIKKHASLNSVNFYPNPVCQHFAMLSIESTLNEKNQVNVYSLLGEKVFQSEVHNGNNLIDLSKLSKGTYFLRIISKNEEITHTIKFIIIN